MGKLYLKLNTCIENQILKKSLFFLFFISSFSTLFTPSFSSGVTPEQKQEVSLRLNSFIEEFNTILVIISGFGAVTCLLIFVKAFIRLGTNYTGLVGHVDRFKDIRDLAIAGILTALFGSITLVLTIFYGTFFG